MRKEEEIREFYREYVQRHAGAELDGQAIASQQYFGAAVACGRTLGKDMRRILKDLAIAKEYLKKQRSS